MKAIRLQGDKWRAVKDEVYLIYYERPNTCGHIKGWYTDGTGVMYTHWLDDDEIHAYYAEIDALETMAVIFVDISPDIYGGFVEPRIPETLDQLNKLKAALFEGRYMLRGMVTREKLLKMVRWIN